MKAESESEVAQSCPALSDPMDCSLPGSSIHGIFWATVLEWGAIAFSLRRLDSFIELLRINGQKRKKIFPAQPSSSLWMEIVPWVFYIFVKYG